MCLTAICRPSLEKYSFQSWFTLFLGCIYFFIEFHELLVYFGDEFPVGIFIANLSPYSEDCACLTVRVSFGRQMVLRLMRSHFLICGLFFIILRGRSTANLAAFYVKSCPVYVFLKNFIVSIITFRYIILFGVYFVYDVF